MVTDRAQMFRIVGLVVVPFLLYAALKGGAGNNRLLAIEPMVCRIEIRDAENQWPVPLVELRTIHQVRFVSDNAGVIAFNLRECFDREMFFFVSGHGYEVAADGFGIRGVRLTPRSGGRLVVEVKRTNVAKRLGRLTGSGLFAECQQCGERSEWKESPLLGCDSVQMTLFRGRSFWNWGDTQFAHYPLGNFDMSGATTEGSPIGQPVPPILPNYKYFLNAAGRTKAMAPIAGKGPTWLTGYASLRDADGREHLVALYRKIKPPLATYEIGLCQWSEDVEQFVPLSKIWNHSEQSAKEPDLLPDGHTFMWRDDHDQAWLMVGNPFPKFRCRATFEAWSDPNQWQPMKAPLKLIDAETRREIEPHSGSMAWNEYRRCWVTVFMERFGRPSAFGELWYAESDHPGGPWRPAVKVLTHDNYTFYNPRLWSEFAQDSPTLLFEGTYTEQFAKAPTATPRYDYNQILYRLDLDDPKLGPIRLSPTDN